jgi:uncharacterized protein (TIGR02996 family)
MAMGRKGTRSITVNGRRYRWKGHLSEIGVNELGDVVVEDWERPGQRLVARFDPWVLCGEYPFYSSKRFVRLVILAGLRRGWRPGASGKQMSLSEDELYGRGYGAAPWTGVEMGRRLLDGVLAQPGADGPRLVLADWLAERGDPRGEFIALQCASAERRLDKSGHERMLALQDRFWRPWSAPARWAARRWCFVRGFISSVTCLGLPGRAEWEGLHRLEPVQDVEILLVGDVDCSALSWLPGATTRSLTLEGPVGDAGIAALCASPHLDALRELTVREAGLTDGAAEALAGAPLRRLRQLDLRSNSVGDGGVEALLASPHLGELRRLGVNRDCLSRRVLRSVEARWRDMR